MNEKTIVTEKVAVEEEDVKVQQRIPISILSEDEGYLLKGDDLTVHAESRVEIHKECYSQEDKTVRQQKKKIKVKTMELATFRHQGKTLNMVK